MTSDELQAQLNGCHADFEYRSVAVAAITALRDAERDACRYQFLRSLALNNGRLEAFVAMQQIDHIHGAGGIDATIDSAIRSST